MATVRHYILVSITRSLILLQSMKSLLLFEGISQNKAQCLSNGNSYPTNYVSVYFSRNYRTAYLSPTMKSGRGLWICLRPFIPTLVTSNTSVSTGPILSRVGWMMHLTIVTGRLIACGKKWGDANNRYKPIKKVLYCKPKLLTLNKEKGMWCERIIIIWGICKVQGCMNLCVWMTEWKLCKTTKEQATQNHTWRSRERERERLVKQQFKYPEPRWLQSLTTLLCLQEEPPPHCRGGAVTL